MVGTRLNVGRVRGEGKDLPSENRWTLRAQKGGVDARAVLLPHEGRGRSSSNGRARARRVLARPEAAGVPRRAKTLRQWCSFELHTVVVDSGEAPLEDDEFED
jgi:hypothetical protein